MKHQYPIVNDDDQIIGYKEKNQAYKEGLMLRAIQIFVYNEDGELFIQKRSKNKLRYPNCFCSSVAGHVEPGESYQKAAIRELEEELGIKNHNNLKFIIKEKSPIDKQNHSITSFFTIKTSDKIKLQEEEIENGNFYKVDDIKELISLQNNFTPGFLYFFNKFHK